MEEPHDSRALLVISVDLYLAQNFRHRCREIRRSLGLTNQSENELKHLELHRGKASSRLYRQGGLGTFKNGCEERRPLAKAKTKRSLKLKTVLETRIINSTGQTKGARVPGLLPRLHMRILYTDERMAIDDQTFLKSPNLGGETTRCR